MSLYLFTCFIDTCTSRSFLFFLIDTIHNAAVSFIFRSGDIRKSAQSWLSDAAGYYLHVSILYRGRTVRYGNTPQSLSRN